MTLQEITLYGSNRKFGKWFHQVCFEAQKDSIKLSKFYVKSKTAKVFKPELSEQIERTITVYIQELYLFYIQIVLGAKFEEDGDSEKVIGKKMNVMVNVISFVFGPRTADLNKATIDAFVTSKRIPEGSLAYLLVDELGLNTNRELNFSDIDDFKERTFDFLEKCTKKAVVPFLKEKFGENDQISRDMIENMGHEW